MSAGGLVAVALVGPAAWDMRWLAWHRQRPGDPGRPILDSAWRPRDGRLGAVGSFVLAAGAGSLPAPTMIGAAVTASRGVEPRGRLSRTRSARFAFLAGAGLFGRPCCEPERHLGGRRLCSG